MGVQGLWKLIDSAGKPIPIETLENKVLAVDVSIWLYQLVKGFQERAGRSVNNPFLLGLFRRICKLLFYRIKPVFVFDGGVPTLKKKTIAARQKSRSKANEISENLKRTLLENLSKQHALGRALGEPNIQLPKMLLPKQDTLFYLSPIPETCKGSDEDSDSPVEELIGDRYSRDDLLSINISSEEFTNLPADIRHDILSELKETRKQNSWANIHLMPENSNDFSKYQMGRLLKRRAVQVGLEKAEGEMGTRGFTICDIKDILKEQGVDVGQRIAADNSTRFLYASSDQNDTSTNKKLKKNEKLNVVEIYSDNSSSEESIDNNINCNPSASESLTQEEILNLIKEENNSKSKAKHTCHRYDINLPSTSRCHVEEELERNITLITSEKFQEKQALVQKNGVNDQEEHTNKLDRDSKRLEVEYENFSQVGADGSEPSTSENQTVEITLLESDITVKKINENLKLFGDDNKNSNKYNSKTVKETEFISQSSTDHCEKVNTASNLIKVSEIDISDNVMESGESSDPGSDNDFLEVNSEQSISTKTDKNLTLPTLEIVVKKDTEINLEEEDLFADVFREQVSTIIDLSEINPSFTNRSNIESDITKFNADSKLSKDECFEEEQTNKINEQTFGLEDRECSENKEVLPKNDFTAQNYFSGKQLNIEEIINMKTNLEKESTYLIQETNREGRIAATISEQTTIEAQELLHLFGLPYIVAPMEAEAQCAYLDETGQTQGTITDDSDVWLFGATNVYKNFFDQKKYVKQFKASDIQRVYHLEREDLIMLAMLSGSDYTSGIQGIGPVNALEIAAQFPPKENSKSPEQRLSRFVEAYSTHKIDALLAKKLKNIQFSEGFPSAEVVKAYTCPRIDDSREPFSWAIPNLEKLRKYTREKFGWDQVTTDQTLVPILDKLQQNKTQRTLHNYFEWTFDGIENKMSRRVERAVNKLRGKQVVLPISPKPINSSSRPPIIADTSLNFHKKSKTPAQVARERAAKKLKEIRQREREMKKQKGKKT